MAVRAATVWLVTLIQLGSGQQRCCMPSQWESPIGITEGFHSPSTNTSGEVEVFPLYNNTVQSEKRHFLGHVHKDVFLVYSPLKYCRIPQNHVICNVNTSRYIIFLLIYFCSDYIL